MAQQSLFVEINPARYGDSRRRQPLILPAILAKARLGILDESQKNAHAVMIKWADLESSGKLAKKKETELQGEFINEVFGGVLGYTRFSANLDHWEIQEHYSLPHGQDADAAIGYFGKENGHSPVAVIELKKPSVNVDRQKVNGRTPVRQCWDYLNELPDCPWGIVCNFVSFRLYHRNHTPQKYELFTLQELRQEDRFKEFLALFSRTGLLDALFREMPTAAMFLKKSQERQQEVGKRLYKDYHDNRVELIAHLTKDPYDKSLDTAISIAQTLLDRIVFIAFCEDRELLPAHSIEKAWRDIGAFTLATNPRWRNFLDLFKSIDKGNARLDIAPFNGGLFAHNAQVDELELDDNWTAFFKNIGGYNFQDEVSVDVLGRIFEQSITDLEAIRAAPAVLLAPAAKVSGKRKREGVYYTPPNITRYIVEETLGPCIVARFEQVAAACKMSYTAEPTKDNLAQWLQCRQAMLESLRTLRVCDPACGSGAFLIQAFNYLLDIYEDIIAQLAEHGECDERAMLDEAKRTILTDNLFGVDLSAEAVEIARLSLWIRSAEKGKSLANLSDNIQCGNSIVDDSDADPKAFDWKKRFKKVFDAGGFDCIVSNPPYVKLQNFRKTHPKIAAYLTKRYRSAQTGNFDMYLPFIEHGLELLNPAGRLGFIAPNVWLFNEYGQGLRELVLEKKSLAKFVDFKSFQVFEDATTYTALQFFSAQPQTQIEVIDAADGKPETHEPFGVSYGNLGSGAWALLPDESSGLVAKIRSKSVPLTKTAGDIIVGIQTSADDVYHLIDLGAGRYYSKASGAVVELESDLLRPLVSGKEAVPFAAPTTDVRILFPYVMRDNSAVLLGPAEMLKHRRTWAYLKGHEKTLRAREGGKFDDDQWYRFGRNQNLDKQHLPKLLIPRLVHTLFASLDIKGELCIDNVDVGGVVIIDGWNLYYLLGVLNSHACNYVWRLTSKPFRGGYRSANKQFIAPLPIPNVKPREQKPVAEIAKSLADLHGKRLEAVAKVRRRIIVDLTPIALVEASPVPPSLPRKLESFAGAPIRDTLAEVEKFAKKKFKPAQREQWDAYLTKESNAVAAVAQKINALTDELNRRVYALYGLGPKEIEVIEKTVGKQ